MVLQTPLDKCGHTPSSTALMRNYEHENTISLSDRRNYVLNQNSITATKIANQKEILQKVRSRKVVNSQYFFTLSIGSLQILVKETEN